MTPSTFVAALLALAAITACVRLAWRWRRRASDAQAWRWCLLLLAQPLFAALLYLVLFPPVRTPEVAGTLTVLTEGAGALRDADRTGLVLALPEAGPSRGVERVPDLGTALRRHPGVRRVRVLGHGLPARDRDAARDVAIERVVPPLPRGLHRVQASPGVVAGGTAVVSGEVGGVPEGRVELFDPAGRRVDAAALDAQGMFALQAPVFAAGDTTFVLRVRDGDGAEVESAQVPLHVEAAVVPRVLLLAGAPHPETRALQRWMREAGFDADVRIAIGGGVQLGSAPAPTRDALAKFDLAVIDARTWSALGEGGRAGVLQAVDDGLGLLLRLDTPMSVATLRGVHGTGFAVSGGNATAAYRPAAQRLRDDTALQAWLGRGTVDVPVDAGEAGATLPELARRAWRVSGARAVPLWRDASGDAIAWWRTRGRGRVAVWTPVETWRLPLLGRADLHEDAWNAAFGTLVRPRASHAIRIEGDARVGERLAVCGAPKDVSVESPDGARTRVLPDAAGGGCAAFWATRPGWHAVHAGEAVQRFHVAAADALHAARLAALQAATQRLSSRGAPGNHAAAAMPVSRMASWPWFLAWLALAAALWWFERSRLGRTGAPRRAAD